MDILVVTDSDSTLIGKYWLDLIVTQTKKYFTEQELKLEEIDEFYFGYQDYSIYLDFHKDYIGEKAFDVFYQHCLQAYNDYADTDDASAYYVDFISGQWDKRNILHDYLDDKIKQQLLVSGKERGYLGGEPSRVKDLQDFIEVVLLWWSRFLKFLRESYNKPTSSDEQKL